MSDSVTVQVVQTNKNHCEKIHYFFLRHFIFHLLLEIATIYILCDNAYLLFSFRSLVNKLIFILDDERMVSTFQYLEFSLIGFPLLSAYQ
jgi:hypothetical protein